MYVLYYLIMQFSCVFRPMFYNIIVSYKIALRVNRRSVRTVNAVDFLSSPHDATPSFHG